jgi:hypothetical protein
MSSHGLPKSRKLWRYTVTLDTEGGEHKLFESILLTEKDAKAHWLELVNDGYKDAAIVVDKDAAAEYQAEKDANRKTKKSTRGGSH